MFNSIYSPVNNLILNDINIEYPYNTRLCSNSTHIEFNNKIYLIPRIEDHSKIFFAQDNFWIDHKDNLLLEFDNIENKVINSRPLLVKNQNDDNKQQRLEHFRIFYHDNKIYSNHSLITPKLHSNYIIRPLIDVYDKVTLSTIDTNLSTIDMIYSNPNIGIPVKDFERNWSFYSNGTGLFLIYSIEPFIVCYSENNGELFNLIHNINYNISWNNYTSNNKMKFRNSCNPIDYDENNMLMFYHLRDKQTSLYYYGIILLDKKTCKINKFSNQPIIFYNSINEKFHRWSNVYYLMSIRKNIQNNTIEIFGGKSHRIISKIILDQNILDKLINDPNYMTTI